MPTFLIRTPTDEELETCTILNLTSQEKWEPNSELLADKENRVLVC
jgi:hypothetical protein